MKNKLGKRALSLLLSALMVVTSVPFAAVNAFADPVDANEHLVAQYLVDDATTGVTNHNVDWDNTKKEAYFKGGADGNSYLELSENPFSTVSSSTGFTVSFDFYKESDIGYWARFFEFSDGTNSYYYALNAGISDHTSFESMCMVNGTQYNYYPADMGNTGYMYGGNAGTAFTDQRGAWHNLAVSMDSDGCYYYVLDGTLMGKYKSDYVNSSENRTINKTDFLNGLKDYTSLYIGYDKYNDPCFKGYMKNLRFYNTGYNNLTDAEKLLMLMDLYEAKMNGTVYKNMANAYKAYVDANEAYDAAVYGNSNTAQITVAYNALQTAMGNMSVWTAPVFDTQAYYFDDVATGGYSNVVYAVKGEDQMFDLGYFPEAGATYFKIFVPKTMVLVYDGSNKVSSPVVAETKRHKKTAVGKQTICYIASKDGTFYFDRQWNGYHDSNWKQWPTATANHFGYQTSDGRNNEFNATNDTSRFWSNELVYHGTGNTSSYYETFSNLTFTSMGYYDNWGGKTGTADAQLTFTDYVINYAPILTEINGIQTLLGMYDVSNYKEGGYADLMTALDAYTSDKCNPKSYLNGITVDGTYYQYSSDAGAAVAKCAACIKSAYETNNGKGIGAADNANEYIALRNAMDYSGLPTNLQDGGALDGRTLSVREIIAANGYLVDTNSDGVINSSDRQLSGYTAFANAYSTAVNVMAALGETGKNTNKTNDYNSGTDAANAAANLISYYNQLSLIAIEAPDVSANTYLGPTDTISVTDTNNGNATYDWEYSTNNGTTWVDGTPDANLGTGSCTFAPFASATLQSAGTVKIRVSASLSGASEYDNSLGETYKFLTTPTLPRADGEILTNNETVTYTTTQADAHGTLQYSVNGAAYVDGSSYIPFPQNSSATSVSFSVREVIKDGNNNIVATSAPTSPITLYKRPQTPTVVADGNYVDNSHGFTVNVNNGSELPVANLQYKIGNGAYTALNYAENSTTSSVKVTNLFNDNTPDTPQSITITPRAWRGIANNYVEGTPITINYLTRPTLGYYNANEELTTLTNGTELTSDQLITLSGVTGAGFNYYLSVDGTNWTEPISVASYTFSPFSGTYAVNGQQVNFANKVKVYVKAEATHSGSVSVATEPVYVYLKKSAPLEVYFADDATGTRSASKFGADGHFYINTNLYSGEQLYYKVIADGVETWEATPYNVNSGIDSDYYYTNNTSVIIEFYVEKNGGKTLFAKGSFVNETYNDFVFHESFDHASTSGTTLNLSNGGTALISGGSGTASVLEGGGWIDSSGNSPDWRNDVLKINANSTAPGNFIRLNTNPLSDPGVATMAKLNGVTISFWRYLERNGACADLDASSDPTGYNWRNAIAFDDGNSTNGQGYYLVEVNGTNSICETKGSNYYDYVQENQDPTGHAAGNKRGNWVNVVVTIDPTNGVTLYTNGEPHNMKANYPKKNGTFANLTEGQVAQRIIDLITSDSTNMYFNYGDKWEGNDYDLYLDDIRIYTGVKTQLDINNMYIDSDADIQSDLTSTSHDPTNVTVYTLAHSVTYTAYDENSNAKSVTLAAGTTVGQEVIDYCGLNPIAGKGDVTKIDYYSFGTGMTIYHYKNENNKWKWEVVGDDAGRCGYQNQKLFGAEYRTADGIKEALDYAATDSRTGAGYLVWAPHVMFNLYTGTWMYYGSTSSWGSSTSAIFVCDGSAGGSIEGPYDYRQIVYKSSAHPNAIDACVYYAYDNTGKPITNNLYMAFGSWGGERCIALKTLYADGDGNTYTTAFDDNSSKFLCNGINNTLEGASDGGSGEGAYIIYDNGYYYLYVSYGQNTGSYVERVFRSTSPTGGFVDFSGTSALDNTTHIVHGGQLLAPFDMSNYDYTFVSTGHSSAYKAVNSYGEIVSVNAAHARPLANDNHDWKGLPDGALATRQYDSGHTGETTGPTGNISLVNLIGYTSNGWPVLLPYQYDGTDTVKQATMKLDAKKLEGVYAADDLQTTEYYNWAKEYTYTIVADDDDETGMSLYEYGTDNSGTIFTNYIVLSVGTDGTLYANYYASKAAYTDNPSNIKYYGVVGMHGNEICISMICSEDYEYTWTYRIGDIPQSEDVNAPVDCVSMDGVIYTHLANDDYTKYGYEISDNFNYGKAGATGERYTTITVAYPAKIDASNPTAVYCLSDEALCKTGEYSGSSLSIIPLNENKWYDASGNKYTDAEAIAAAGVGRDGSVLHRLYGLKGYVSNYYFDETTGKYAEKGVSLIVSYTDITDNAKYSEFEFCYVTYNPAMAHTIVGIRNKREGVTVIVETQEEMRAGLVLLTRLENSYGSSTSYIPTAKEVNATVDGNNETAHYFGTGNFDYLYQFPNSTVSTTDSNYTSAANINDKFTYYDSKTGVNSGSFALVEHYNTESYGNDKPGNFALFTAASNVVNADYYIDYSDDQNSLITYENNVPTGYKFDFFASNLYWLHHQNVKANNGETTDEGIHRATSFVKNNTDLTMSVKPVVTSHNINDKKDNNHYYYIKANTAISDDNNYFGGITSGNQWLLNNQGTSQGTNYETILKTMTTDGTADYSKLTPAFEYVDAGVGETADWQGRITFTGTGFKNVTKATGNTAETAHNFAYEQGLSYKRTWAGGWGATSEQTFHYYNIGVSTCDKGAARSFLENYLNKQLETEVDETTGEATVILDEYGAPSLKDGVAKAIVPQNCTLASYQEYIDAVSELAWFIENPTNTTFADYSGSGSNAKTHYVTAYTEDGEPIYLTTVAGDNIFNKGVTNVNTDEVQAQLIKNVIEAYENLFSKTDYTEAEEEYAKIEIASTSTTDDTINIYENADKTGDVITYNKADFTDDSWNNFVALTKGVESAFEYDTTKDKGEESWRSVELSGSEYRKLVSILENAEGALMKKLDTSELASLVVTKSDTRDGGIFAEGEQRYTLQSWLDLDSTIGTAEGYINNPSGDPEATYTDENGTQHSFTVGKYNVTGVTKYNFDTVVYYAQEFNATDFTKANYAQASNCSAAQANIYGQLDAGNSDALINKSLAPVDTAQSYETYDAAYSVINSAINLDKYVDGGRTLISNELAKRVSVYDGTAPTSAYGSGTVYITPTSAQATAYNTATGESITSETLIKNAVGTGTVDAYTATLLSTANSLEDANNLDTYVKKFTGTVQVTDVNGEPIEGYETPVALTNSDRGGTNFYYGDTYEVPIPEAAQGKCVISVTYTDPYNGGETVSSQKVSYNGTSFSKIANNNMEVIIKITENTDRDDYYKVHIRNLYGTIVETIYVTEANLDNLITSENWETNSTLNFTEISGSDTPTRVAPAVPFFTFSKWQCSKNAGTKTATFTPFYNQTVRVALNINGADSVTGAALTEGTTYDTAFDNLVTITTSGVYGWATVASDGKYQIAAYGDSVQLYAVCAETFYPITKSGDDYYVNGNKLTAANVDVKFTVDTDTNALLKQKLDERKPFVSLIDVTTVKNNGGRFSSGSAYCRVTTGASDYSEIGVLATSKVVNMTDTGMVKGTTKDYKTSTVLKTGQYTYTINSTGSGFAAICFRGYISYDLDYTANQQSATLNVPEYSNTFIQRTAA